MKRQTLLPSLLWISLVSRLVYLMLILNTILTNIFLPLGKMIGMVRLRTSFILATCPGRLAVLQAMQDGRTCLVSCPHRSYTSDPFTQTVRHILVECNLFSQERKDVFDRRDVVESLFYIHPTLILLFLKQRQFYTKF